MEFEYNWNKDDLKKQLQDSRNKTNIKFLIFGILAFLYFTYYAIKLEGFDNKVILKYGVIYLFVLCLILYLSAKLYVFLSLRKNDKKTNKAYGTYKVKIDDNNIIIRINEQEIKYNYNEINKFKVKKKYFFINTKIDKIGLTFKKDVIGEVNYKEALEYIRSRINK